MTTTCPAIVVVFAILVAAQSGAPQSSQNIPVDQENQRKAKAILDQAIEALGGQAYLTIRDITQEGRTYSFYQGRPNSNGAPFWRFYKYPDKDRIELLKKREWVQIVNGDKGYDITYKGTSDQDAKTLSDYIRRRGYALDYVLRTWVHESGIAMFYEGHGVVEGHAIEQISIMNSKNQGVTLFIDSDTHLPVKKRFTWRDPTDKERNVEDEVYDNYRPVQGIMTPHSVTRYRNGDMSNQRFITVVSYNQGLPDSIFESSFRQPYIRK